MTTLDRMRAACGAVSNDTSPHRTFIEACGAVADEMVANTERIRGLDLKGLATEMRANSERWFPELHSHPVVPLDVFYAIGLAGESGECLDAVKKTLRDHQPITRAQHDAIAAEMADAFTYLLLLADERGIDLLAEYEQKVVVNERRWGKGRA